MPLAYCRCGAAHPVASRSYGERLELEECAACRGDVPRPAVEALFDFLAGRPAE